MFRLFQVAAGGTKQLWDFQYHTDFSLADSSEDRVSTTHVIGFHKKELGHSNEYTVADR